MGETQKRKCCCQSCKVGSEIPRWVNDTKVRPPGDTLGPNYSNTPFPRYDQGTYETDHGAGSCAAAGAGFCGVWLAAGDFNGLSAQEIDDTVDDIMACAANDSTHQKSDLNCYHQTGTVDMRQDKLFGGQWILARKFWHGIAGIMDRNDPHQITGVASFDTDTGAFVLNYSDTAPDFPDPYQLKYRTMAVTLTGNEHVPTGPDAGDYNCSAAGTSTVGRYTGIEAHSGSHTPGTPPTSDASGFLNGAIAGKFALFGLSWNDIINSFTTFTTGGASPTYTNPSAGVYTKHVDDGFGGTPLVEQLTVTAGFCSRDQYEIDGTTLVHHDEFTFSNTGFSYSSTDAAVTDAPTVDTEYTFTVAVELTDAYTAVQCYDDFKTLLATWDMSDMNLASFRADEALALAPLCIYDEVGQTIPIPTYLVTMDDYAAGLVDDSLGHHPGDPGYVTTWAQRGWLDPHDYVWKFPNGSYVMPGGFTSGATLITPLVSGSIIAHNQAGSDRHFWFGYGNVSREAGIWVGFQNGGESDGSLPPVTLRWMNNEQAQADGGNHGNFPQAFLTEQGGELRGAKFVQATQKWPSVNFGRPCGADKYAVEQTTICCINVGLVFSVFTVKTTGEAIEPLATGGLAVNDYIFADGAGIYKITGIASTVPDGDGNPQWLITVGSKLDDLPTGGDLGGGSDCLGRLRFPFASGICGRAACTSAFAAGTVTFTTDALPYLRLDPTTGTLLVDVYDSAMTLLVGSLALTRVSDTSFTAPHSALPASAWLIGAGVDWTKYDSTSKKTGIHLEWMFNARKASGDYGGTVPMWYADTPGCLTGTVTQFNYTGACPSAVGIVPHYDDEAIENFPNSVLFGFPDSFPFDDKYSAHWQAAVMLTMPDPFWQKPFKPSCVDSDFAWTEDDGSGHADDSGPPAVSYYAHHPLVEALKDIPGGDSLPAGVSLFYSHPIAPPYYPNGIPCDSGGGYISIEMDWGFTLRACADIGSVGRFSADYLKFISC